MTSRPFALYAHVPFCSRKCPYCDFTTYATTDVPEREYVEALKKDVVAYASDPRFAGRHVATVFFGGGTPSLLSPAAIGDVISQIDQSFGILAGAEVTLEANPSSPSRERFSMFRAAGVNRVSFGVQSFDEQRLALLGREHSPGEAKRAVEECVEAGISNVSVDIIFGVENQAVSELERDLDTAASLPITHLSTYALTIEPGTPFFQRQQRGLLVTPPDDRVGEMLRRIPVFLRERGFSRYEISNYARDDRFSRHNEAYWTGGDYLGIGAGAHSYVGSYDGECLIGASRWSMLASPPTYMKNAGTSATVSWREELSQESLWFEFFYLGLRRAAGVRLTDFRRRFSFDPRDVYGDVIDELAQEGFLVANGECLALSEDGIALADSVYERFIR